MKSPQVRALESGGGLIATREPVKDLGEFLTSEPEGKGTKKTLQDLVGQQIVITKLSVQPSKFNEDPDKPKDYLHIEATLEGEPIYVNTQADVILEQAEQIKDKLPGACTVEQRKSAAGRNYFILVGAPAPSKGFILNSPLLEGVIINLLIEKATNNGSFFGYTTNNILRAINGKPITGGGCRNQNAEDLVKVRNCCRLLKRANLVYTVPGSCRGGKRVRWFPSANAIIQKEWNLHKGGASSTTGGGSSRVVVSSSKYT